MMPPDPRKIEEWLSGLLDGDLSEQEQRQLESAMENDPSIAQRLEEMTNLRRYLLQGRTVGRLGTDFSKRVVQAARERAGELAAPPDWVLPDAPNAVPPQSQESQYQESQWGDENSQAQRPYPESIDLANPATTLRNPLFAHLVSRKATAQPLISNHQPEEASVSIRERFVSVWIPSLAVVLALVAMFLFLPRNSTDSTTTPAVIAANDSGSPKNSGSSNDQATPSGASDKDATLANLSTPAISDSQSAPPVMPEVPQPVVPPSVAQTPSDPAADPLKQMPPPGPDGKYTITLFAQISVDSQATENQMLQELFEKYEIIASSDILLENQQLETLVGSKILKGPVVDPSAESTKSAMYLIKSNAKRIDSLLRDVEAQYQDFPSYRLGVSFDPQVFQLMDHLSAVTDSPDSARKLRLDANTGSSSGELFDHDLNGLNVDIEARKSLKSGKSLAGNLLQGDNSFIILLVRPAN